MKPANRVAEKRRAAVSLVLSTLLHGVGLSLLTAWSWMQGDAQLAPEPPPPRPKTIEVTLSSKPAAVPVAASPPQAVRPAAPKLMPLANAEGLDQADRAPIRPIFESDENRVAASENPATGSVPLPSQEGRLLPFTGFESKTFLMGKAEQPLDAFPDEEVPDTDDAEGPLFKPKPIPVPPTPKLTDRDILPVPQKEPEITDLPKPTPIRDLALNQSSKPPGTRAPPRPPPQAPGYQPQNERTKIEGSISNKGRASVDAVSSPIGRYRKAIADAIGPRWHERIRKDMGLITVGSARIKFYVTESGKIEKVDTLSNSSSEAFKNASIASIHEARIPPLPPDVVPLLEDGRLEIEYTFTIY